MIKKFDDFVNEGTVDPKEIEIGVKILADEAKTYKKEYLKGVNPASMKKFVQQFLADNTHLKGKDIEMQDYTDWLDS